MEGIKVPLIVTSNQQEVVLTHLDPSGFSQGRRVNELALAPAMAMKIGEELITHAKRLIKGD